MSFDEGGRIMHVKDLRVVCRFLAHYHPKIQISPTNESIKCAH